MIAITLAEKEAIREKFPDIHIVRTMKQDSHRHHYFMVEEAGPMRMLNKMRGIEPANRKRRRRRDNRRDDRRGNRG